MASTNKGNFLQIFWDLASPEKEVRFASVKALDAHLKKSCSDDEDGDNGEGETRDETYALKRLVRGLCSSREAARQGFALALANTLRARKSISLKSILAQVLRESETPKSLSGQEMRNQMFGRLFGFMAIARSGRLAEGDEEVEAATDSIIQATFKIASRRSWLSELCCEIVVDVASRVPTSVFEKVVLTRVDDALKDSGADSLAQLTPDLLSVVLNVSLSASRRGISGSFFTAQEFASVASLKPRVVACMAEPLRASCARFPRLHVTWAHLMDAFEASGDDDNHDELLFTLWTEVVEGKLLSSTHERRCTALLVFGAILGRLRASGKEARIGFIPRLLTRKFLKCLVTTLSASNAILHNAAKDAMRKLESTLRLSQSEAEASSEALRSILDRTRLGVVSALICNGDRNFDKRTKTKSVARLLAGVSKDSVSAYAEFWAARIKSAQLSPTAFTGACEALYAVSKISFDEDGKNSSSGVISIRVGEILMEQVLSSPADADDAMDAEENEEGEAAAKAKAASVCRMRLLNVIADLSSPSASASDKSLASIRRLQDFYKTLKVTDDDDAARSYVVGMALGQADKLRASKETTGTAKCLELVIRHIAMQLLLRCDEDLGGAEDAMEDMDGVVRDLCEASKRLVHGLGDTKVEEEEMDEVDDIRPMSVVVESMMQLLSLDSAVLRQVVKQGFALICDAIDEADVDSLLDVLTSRHRQQSSKENDGDDEDEEDEDLIAQDEMHRQEAGAGTEAEACEGDEKNGDDSDDDAVITNEEDLIKVLGGAEDEDEMDKYDRALAEYMRHRAAATGSGKSAHKQMSKQRLKFKLRVLDLIETLISSLPESSLLTRLPVPLLASSARCLSAGGVFDDNEARALFERLQSLQNKLFKAKSLPKVSGERETIAKILNDAVEFACKAGSIQLLKTCGAACVYAVRASKSLSDPLKAKDIESALEPALEDWLCKKGTRIRASFFHVFLQAQKAASWESVIPLLLRICCRADGSEGAPRSIYCRCEGLKLATVALRHTPSGDAAKQALPALWEAFLAGAKTLAASDGERKERFFEVLDLAKGLLQISPSPPKPLSKKILAALAALEGASKSPKVNARVAKIKRALA